MTDDNKSKSKETKPGVSIEHMHKAAQNRLAGELDGEEVSEEAEHILSKAAEEATKAESFDHGPNDAGKAT